MHGSQPPSEGSAVVIQPVQYAILDPSLGMSAGKAAAQAMHAGQLGLLTHVDNDTTLSPYNKSIVNRWMRGGHYAKVVLEATDLPTVERYLNDRGFATALIIDEGRTELDGLTPTAIGTGVVDKDQPHVREVFGEFKLYGAAQQRREAAESVLAQVQFEHKPPTFIERLRRGGRLKCS